MKNAKRKLLFAERMLHGDGRTPFNAVIPFRIKGNIAPENLEGALRKLQHKHPLLNAFVEKDAAAMPWFVLTDPASLEIPVHVIKRTSEEDWKTISEKQWAIPFDTATGPLVRVIWVKGEVYSELILVIHHCLCDGGSAMAILTALLELTDNPDAAFAVEEPIMDASDIIPQEILKSKRKRAKAKLIGGLASFVLWMIPLKKKLVERKRDYMIHWKVEKELSDPLIARCKAEGVTVNTALCTALLLAFKAVRKENFHNKVSCPVDIRRFAPGIKKDNIFAFGLMFVVSLGKMPGFFDCAREMQNAIDRKTASLNAYDTIMMMEASHPALNNFTRFLKYGKSGNDCMFSNLGRINIPHVYRSFTLDTLFSPSVIGPLGNTTTMVTSTYRGQMDFTFIASEGFIPYEEAQAIKNQMMAILTQQV
ncbi:NRPS condensation-like uncharacterized protein [Pedobacter africanus]|uniref:NRPS condensation-like uncharacterized protein n=1 Tax=Pedobacter africanus TaxID=151894 RepID=A0ACC6L517_9SPHI|nr:condensation domain-containing protein [Pedobacter africanus]MDR6786525.1 NRPS condensation-like uncharacterized protein [Pedobacter africanus]